jgi:hypothetical protein
MIDPSDSMFPTNDRPKWFNVDKAEVLNRLGPSLAGEIVKILRVLG